MLEVNNLDVYAQFLHSTERIVRDVSFFLQDGERLAIVGESGSGKSMIVNALTASLADNCYATGSIVFDGIDVLNDAKRARAMAGRRIVFVPQGGAEALNPALKIKTQIYEAFVRGGHRLNKDEKKAYAIYNLSRVGLQNGEIILEKYPFELSGGEAQRVVLAIALCANAKLIIADEATRGIDQKTSEIFWECIDKDFSFSSLIVVTHDMSVARNCDKVLVLKDGEVKEYGDTCSVFVNPQDEYTKSLLAIGEVKND